MKRDTTSLMDDNDTDDDETYYDSAEWEEGQVLVGAIKFWNDERDYGVLVVLDDYSVIKCTIPITCLHSLSK